MKPSPNSVCFGPFRLDPQTLELWHEEERVPLEPLCARILLRLVSSEGTMVPRRELLELGWPNLPGAAEQSLNTCVHQIRRALTQTDGKVVVELETLRGRGYRLAVVGAKLASRSTVGAIRSPWVWATVMGAAAAVLALRGPPNRSLPAEAGQALERAWYLAETTADLPAARAVLDSARRKFPEAANLHSAWGEVSFWLGDHENAKRATDLALRLEPQSASAHRARGLLAMVRSDWIVADSALTKALRIDPSDTRTLTTLAYRRVIEGRFEVADLLMRHALQNDPLSTIVNQDAGYIYLLAARYEDAERYCGEALRFKPRSEWATDCLFDLMVLQARTEEAATWGRRLMEISGGSEVPAEMRAGSVVARVEAWRLERWTRAVREGAYPYGLALALVANGRPTEALRALQAAAETPTIGLLVLGVDPRLASLRGRADFRHLLEQLQLPA